MGKTIEELKKINTKNLLRFYKAERNRMFNNGYRYVIIDEDDNNNPVMGWENPSKSDTFSDDIDFLYLIKSELSRRENVNVK